MKDGVKTILIQLVGWVVLFVVIAFAMKGCHDFRLHVGHDQEQEAYYTQSEQEEKHWAEEEIRNQIDELTDRQNKIETALDDLYFELGESDEKFEESETAEILQNEYDELEKDINALKQKLEEIE